MKYKAIAYKTNLFSLTKGGGRGFYLEELIVHPIILKAEVGHSREDPKGEELWKQQARNQHCDIVWK